MANALLDLMQPEACCDPMNWPLMNSCLPHAEWLFGQFEKRSTGELSEQIIQLGRRAEILLFSRALLHRARKLQERALKVCRRIMGSRGSRDADRDE